VSKIHTVGTNQLVMTINKAYSSTWFV